MAEIGEVIRGRYRVKKELGRGGVAIVYLVEDLNLGVDRALKELSAIHAVDLGAQERFLNEAKLAASLVHPNIVTVHDHFVWEGTPFIVMEYFARGDTRKLVGALNHEQVVALIAAVLSGLDAAEQAGILHRDLKPDNLLRTNGGSVKIGDFGIAKTLDVDPNLTPEGLLPGTAAYVAPELLDGRPATPASDLYSVGVIAYELLRGIPPFAKDRPNLLEIIDRKRSEETVPISVVVPDLHIEIASWIDRLLSRDPSRRYQRAAEARDSLEARADRAFGSASWQKQGSLPVTEPPKPTTKAGVEGPPSRFVGRRELFRIVAPRTLIRWAATRPTSWLVAAAVAGAALGFDERWLFGVGATAFASLAMLTYFDQREAYLARGVGRRRRRRRTIMRSSRREFG